MKKHPIQNERRSAKPKRLSPSPTSSRNAREKGPARSAKAPPTSPPPSRPTHQTPPSPSTAPLPDGRCRAVIAAVRPEICSGRFPVKRTIGELFEVCAHIFADGHDQLSAVVQHRHEDDPDWAETRLVHESNDVWRARFHLPRLGTHRYRVLAWVDHFKSWQRDLAKRRAAGQDLSVELIIGAGWIKAAATRATRSDAATLAAHASALADPAPDSIAQRTELALSPALTQLMNRWSDRSLASTYERELRVTVDPTLARFGAWYEMFPRSAGPQGRHGTFRDVEQHLPRLADLGFDVLYLPPIHPIGRAFRKGRNNNVQCLPGEPGSPWAIGSTEGGHKSVHPELGTLEDFRRLVHTARQYRIEVALDIAFQCSPDHPYVREHPQWFRHRPDGTIQYAENPPKKYQDIYPFDFETPDWQNLWTELKSIFEFWISQGVTIFRVDNPHTKAFAFWEWCIADLKRRHPELIFLSEAFTRPKLMYRLAQLGYTQSYNYFPWRNTRHELTEYFTELTTTEVREFLRPNLWPNTPDILTAFLQTGGPPAFSLRLTLAATLGAAYGIYGPPFELCLQTPREPGSEEYLDSEKYEIRSWNLAQAARLSDLIRRLNRIRRDNPALQFDHTLRFHRTDNPQLLAYSKTSPDGSNVILVIVNLDPHFTQQGWLEFPLGTEPTSQVNDLLTEASFLWTGDRHFIELNPHHTPAHVLRLRRHVLNEQDFDYYC